MTTTRRRRGGVWLALVPLWLGSGSAGASDVQFGALDLRFQHRVAGGVAWRMQPRDERLLAKLNVPGQETLCAEDSCMSTSGDPEPNARLLAARGGFNVNGDDGNLNYAEGDITYATTQYEGQMLFDWGPVFGEISGLAYYDPVNADFDTFNQNTLFQPRNVPRRADLGNDIGADARLLEAFVSYPLTIGDRALTLSIGRQIRPWGESTFLVFSSLNQVNPLSARLLRQPGGSLKNAFLPVGMVTADIGLTDTVTLSALYQYEWQPTEPDPAGSFNSVSDVAAAGRGPTNLTIGIGQFAEDPERLFRPTGNTGLISSATRTAYLLDESFGEPRDSGQFGLRINYFADWLNGGTEIALYGLNYHSRLPYLNVFAAEASCLRNADNVDSGGAAALVPALTGVLPGLGGVDPAAQTAFSQAFIACGGFNGSANVAAVPALQALAATVPGAPAVGQEPLPVDTISPFLTYPEDIHLFGTSGNTNVGNWSWAWDLAYTPNQPLQVATRDVLFAALSPAFPTEDIGLPTSDAAAATIPSASTAVPDFIQTRYRNAPAQGRQLIRGYERLPVLQMGFTGIRAIGSSNWIGADQILFLVELGGTRIFDMPDLDQLQFEGAGATNTHYSPGADGTGSGGVPDTQRVNPTQANPNIFADSFAWGYRMLFQPSYNNALFGRSVTPRLLFFHDVSGTSASPVQNFVEGQRFFLTNVEVRLGRNLTGSINYFVYTGAGDRNLRRDRDQIALSMAYDF